MKKLSDFVLAALAGMSVALGGVVFLSCESKVVGKTAQPRALAMGAGLPCGGKTKYVTSCDNVFLTNILLASTPSVRRSGEPETRQ